MPFLTVVTRCYKRPKALKKNIRSLEMQTEQDFEQVFIVDEEGKGLHEANKALASATVRGDYVMVLDDDDMLSCPDSIATMGAAVGHHEPDLLVFRGDHGPRGILPPDALWGKRLQHGYISSCDFITRREVWERHIEAFGVPRAGDFRFLCSVMADDPDVYWLDRQLAEIQQIGNGRPE